MRFRGHHDVQVQSLLLEQIAKQHQTNLEIAKKRARNYILIYLLLLDSEIEKDRKYVAELIGPNGENQDVFFGSLIQGFLAILDAPDDACFIFGTEQDWVCHSCFDGSHCFDPDEILADVGHIKYLVQTFESQNLPVTILKEEIMDFVQNGEVTTPTEISITKGDLIKYLSKTPKKLSKK
jgi:hypothetical protein